MGLNIYIYMSGRNCPLKWVGWVAGRISEEDVLRNSGGRCCGEDFGMVKVCLVKRLLDSGIISRYFK